MFLLTVQFNLVQLFWSLSWNVTYFLSANGLHCGNEMILTCYGKLPCALNQHETAIIWFNDDCIVKQLNHDEYLALSFTPIWCVGLIRSLTPHCIGKHLTLYFIQKIMEMPNTGQCWNGLPRLTFLTLTALFIWFCDKVSFAVSFKLTSHFVA